MVATIKVLSSYTFNSVTSVSVGGKALSTSDYTVRGQIVTIPANKINGNVVITVATEKVNTEPEEPGTGGDSGETPDVPSGTSETIIFMEQELIDGFYAQSGALQSSASHSHFVIPANNVKSITITPDGIGTVSKLYYVIQTTSDNQTIRMFDIMNDFSEGNMTKTIELENNTGDLYFNVFDAKKTTNTYGYAREAIITYK